MSEFIHKTSARSEVPITRSQHLVVGPAALVIASLIDLYLVTRVFVVAADPLAGVLTFFIFGAASGVPLQVYFARSRVGRAMDGAQRSDTRTGFRATAPIVAGVLAAISTVAWLYCLSVADAAVVLPLANLTPLVFGVVEGLQGRIRLRYAIFPLLLLLAGLYVFSTPHAGDVAGLTSLVILLLVARNLASAGSEIAERQGAFGSAARFAAIRFGWLAGVGVPVALAVAVATSRLEGCLGLMLEALPMALPLHAFTMLLTFVGSVRRTQAKATCPLTTCTAVYATPLVLAPLLGAVVNEFAVEFFPTITGSVRLTVAAVIVVVAAMWLSALPPQPQTSTATSGPRRIQ